MQATSKTLPPTPVWLPKSLQQMSKGLPQASRSTFKGSEASKNKQNASPLASVAAKELPALASRGKEVPNVVVPGSLAAAWWKEPS